MINVLTSEYREGDYAINIRKVTFLGIPIYSSVVRSTDNRAVRQLTAIRENKVVKGFNLIDDESDNKDNDEG